VWERTTRLNYVYAAAQSLEDREPEEVTNEVLEHLEGAQVAMRLAWGQTEWQRLGDSSPADLQESISQGLRKTLGDSQYADIEKHPLKQLHVEIRSRVINELGRQSLTEVYRQLLLSVISELWVEYLTSMEALRVSIGLEAYAQRDPLVQYKNKAFAMFQELLENMRLAVVNRMFTFRPRELSRASIDQRARKAETESIEAGEQFSIEETEMLSDKQAEPARTVESTANTSQSKTTSSSTSTTRKPMTSGKKSPKISKSQKRRRRRKKK
jgi:preprotein translocase subunit SecA